MSYPYSWTKFCLQSNFLLPIFLDLHFYITEFPIIEKEKPINALPETGKWGKFWVVIILQITLFNHPKIQGKRSKLQYKYSASLIRKFNARSQYSKLADCDQYYYTTGTPLYLSKIIPIYLSI